MSATEEIKKTLKQNSGKSYKFDSALKKML